jgi:diaminopimelate epimerase
MHLIKSHALGNDFLLIEASEVADMVDRPAFARDVCDRHRGVGADGLIVFESGERGASMRLLNADGSRSEVSGNGVRCLAAWLASTEPFASRKTIEIETDAGLKSLELLDRRDGRYTFRASMGQPEHIDRVRLDVGGASVDAITLRVGNPQCVVLGEVTQARLHSVAAALAVHPHFPEGTNVELAAVAAPDHVKILIWERGVGPTEASGTGACAAAVASIRYGGAARDVQIESPGGTQRVEWHENGLYLTGWAELIAESRWLRAAPAIGSQV